MVKLSYNMIKHKYSEAKVPWGPIGYITYKRTYSRMKPDGTQEEWWETILRCIDGIQELGADFTHDELLEFYDYVFNLKCCFSGRALWQLGTQVVHQIGADSLQNCWAVSCNELESFLFVFNQLMLGGGVGFNIQADQVYSLPIVKSVMEIRREDTADVGFIIPDNRDGWVTLLKKILDSYFVTQKSFTYSTMAIRSRGAKIKTFGGVASGPEALVEGITNICKILDHRVGRKLRPIDCLDIMNLIGNIVVSGNVRRSAQLALGDCNDLDFLTAKNWGSKQIPNWRSMSNNSVACSDIEDLPDAFWENYHGNGEPYGLINIENCRKYGRMGEEVSDPSIMATNPCGEIPLAPYEPCNLGEIFLPNMKDLYEFKKAAYFLYRTCTTIMKWPFLNKRTNDIVYQNRKIGIGITGYYDEHNHLHHLSEIYNYLEAINTEECSRLTTVKPSGTLSLLAGTTPGMHPAFSRHYIRRIRMPSNSPLIDVCVSHGYHVEPEINYDGTLNHNTLVVSFPVGHSSKTVCSDQVSTTQMLRTQRHLQRVWADNAVSATVYYDKEYVYNVRYDLENYWDHMKGVSFLLKQDHGFIQAPMEPISERKYRELVSKTKPIDKVEVKDQINDDLVEECEGGLCPVR